MNINFLKMKVKVESGMIIWCVDRVTGKLAVRGRWVGMLWYCAHMTTRRPIMD
jgi:hypothetical protein